MVDEYDLQITLEDREGLVQIPLWSMNTTKQRRSRFQATHVQIPLWSMNTQEKSVLISILTRFRFLYGRWIRVVKGEEEVNFNVQIPLWSMNTRWPGGHGFSFYGSDSSMVDEYSYRPWVDRRIALFRFLYGRWIRFCNFDFSHICVRFRFLYGRWIRWF